jgi:ferredoxin
MKVVVDRSRCTGIGICESMAPDRFEVDDDGELTVLAEEVSPEDKAQVEEAISSCPTIALSLVES